MTSRKAIVPVIAAPMIDPGMGRIRMELPPGLTITEIVDLVLPDRAFGREFVRVALVTDHGSQIVDPKVWHVARPHAGVHVVIRVVPGKDALKSILSVVVSIAALAIGAYFAPMLAGTFGIGASGWQGIIGLGVTVIGNLLINALIPPPKPDDKQQNRYAISGWKNRLDPDGAIPFPVGEIRIAPPFACMPHSEIVGDFLYVRAMFLPGYGPLLTSDYRIGETSLSEYDEVDIEVRDGRDDDAPITLFPYQIAEESVGAELLLPLPRNDLGEVVSGPPEQEPITRATGRDAKGASVILSFPAGLFRTNDSGKLRSHTVSIQILQRRIDAEEWQEVITLEIKARQREGFYRQHTWDYPSRGDWQVRCVMLTAETEDMKKQQKVAWAALQTIRPEYPINMKGLALIGVRVKSTHQLSGQLDNFNFLTRRPCLDYDHTTGQWVERETRNPASIFRLILQHPGNPRAEADSGIDLEQLEDWHDFCRVNGLKFDRSFEDVSASIGEALDEVAAAGRASKRHDGMRWGVVIDRPREILTIDDYSPRNSFGFEVTRSYTRRPDAIIVKFLDATNDYKQTQRIVRWPGHEGEISLTEGWDMSGKTDPDEIFVETTRRMLELIHRPDVYRLSLDGPIGTATRGDLVNVSHNVVERAQTASRVRSVSGKLVELDDLVSMEAGEQYALQFRVFTNDDDAFGTSYVRMVQTVPGESAILMLADSGMAPRAGDLVHFGILGKESLKLIISGIEAGEDFSSHLRLIDAAPVIDEEIEALEIPAWSGRIGAEIDQTLLQPPAPRFTSVTSGVSGTDETGLVDFLIVPGTGTIASASFTVNHRLVGSTAWQTLVVSAAEGGGSLTYANGQQVELQAFATSPGGQAGPMTAVITLMVGQDDAAIPAALDPALVTVGALLGGAVVQFSTSDDQATAQVQIYRSTSAVINRATDAVGEPIIVEPSRSYPAPIGDTTRKTLIVNGDFAAAGTWTFGGGWSQASGRATHAAGSAGSIVQSMAAAAGKFYRFGGTLSGVAAGTLTPRLTGGTIRTGTVRSANGEFSDRVQAVTGNNAFSLLASSTFEGSIDDVYAYLETATCLAQGVHYIWLEPQNEDGVPGPLAGPFTVTIR